MGKAKRLREQRAAARAKAAEEEASEERKPPEPAIDPPQQRPMQMPVFCPNCGLIFESRLIAISGPVGNLQLEGNREQCPRCGALAELPEGTFNVVGNTLEVLEATPLTRARLSQLAFVLDRAQRGEISEDQLADAIEREEGLSGFADLLRQASPRVRHALIALLIFVVQVIANHELEDHLWGSGATNAQIKQDLSALSSELRDDHRHVNTEIQRAVQEALMQYNAEHRVSPRHGPSSSH